MKSSIPRGGRVLLTTCLAFMSVLLASCWKNPHISDEDDSEAASSSSSVVEQTPDPNAAQISLIPAGTVVGSTAPSGWTHLIDKSKPKLEFGDVDQVPENMKNLSGMFFTAMVARVLPPSGPAEPDYRIDDVAINMGKRIGDNDTIITPETQEKLGAGLGFLARMALDHGNERLRAVRVATRTKTIVIVDGPSLMVREGKHLPAVVRYAIMVDPKTGRLETLLWAIGVNDQGAYTGMFGECEWLGPDHVEDRVMHVDASEFTFGILTETALAMARLFHGHTQFTFPPDLKALAERPRFTPETAAELETRLWGLIRSSVE